jgi:hypothetical protein
MKKLILMLILMLKGAEAFAAIRPCSEVEFDLMQKMAENQNYQWTGSLKTCTVDESPGVSIFWSAPAAGGVMGAVLMPRNRIQFMSGGSIRLFCMQLIDGRWIGTGKDCPN